VRIVTHLENRYANFDGLNLTWETLEGIAKHNGPLKGFVGAKPLPRAMQYYADQHDLELDTHASIEAQIAAIADDIAYNNHDIDDGLRAGFFTLTDLEDLPLLGDIIAQVKSQHPTPSVHRQGHEIIRRMVADVLTHTRLRIDHFKITTPDDVRKLGQQLVQFSGDMEVAHRSIKSFLFKYMYRHFKVNRMTSKARRVVGELFQFFHAEPNCLPAVWYAQTDGAKTQRTAEVIADFIAGMTDRFALEEHARIFDPMART
jgi:dGTPase